MPHNPSTGPEPKVFFVSSKEEKSGELVERAHGILSRLPPHGGGGRLVGQTASPHQCGWITEPLLSGWRRGRETFSAMKPTMDGGGRITIVSSAYPGTFAELVRGELLSG